MNSPYVDPMSGRQYGTRYDGTRISVWGGHFLAPLPVPPSPRWSRGCVPPGVASPNYRPLKTWHMVGENENVALCGASIWSVSETRDEPAKTCRKCEVEAAKAIRAEFAKRTGKGGGA